jgi:Domain of unknown function (DUF397)
MEEVRGMTEIDLSRAEWRKSSYSSQSGNCVEVARNLPGLVAVRDSIQPDGDQLVVRPQAWRAFLRRICTSAAPTNLA